MKPKQLYIKNYHLTFEQFGFAKEITNAREPITCSKISYNCVLWMTTKEQVCGYVTRYDVDVRTISSLQESMPGFFSQQRMAIINCSLIEKIPGQLTSLVEKANEAEGFIPIDYPEGQQPKSLADGYISYYFRATDSNYLNFCSNFDNNGGFPVEKIQFCGDKPWEVDCTNGVERYLLSNSYISFCSWQFAEGQSINDPYNFNVKIIFKAYDHGRSQFFELSINACSIQWLEQESNNTPILFLRYIMVMDFFDEKHLREYVFYTMRVIAYCTPTYPDYDIAMLSFGYQLSPEYLKYAKESEEPYAYY